MDLITKEELKIKIDQRENFRLVMALGQWHFNAKRIPGSIRIDNPEDASEILQKDDEIVVYCSNPQCVASQVAYNVLRKHGYINIKRYAGGIDDWEDAGYPLEGDMVETKEIS